MTSDDQFFFDYLAQIPNDVRRYSEQVADSINRHVDHAADAVRNTLSHQSWLPSSVRPSPAFRPFSPRPQSLYDRVHDWAIRNRAWSAAILAFVGTTGVLYFGSKKLRAKRRKAKRSANGARKEIIVVAGSPHEPMTRSIAADLDRRGYIVYITVSSAEEEQLVRAENRPDIRPLWLDLATLPSSPSEIHSSLNEIHTLITQPHAPMPGVPPHVCQLSGLILVPSPKFAAGPVATIPPSSWVDTINTRLLSPILTTQLFLPLLTLRNTNSTIILVYPSISSSLSAPFAGPEVTTARALVGFATSLRRELSLLHHNNVDLVELKLGNIDLGPQYRAPNSHIAGTEVLTWSVQQRALYGPQYLNSIEQRPVASAGPGFVRGSPARALHNALLDALEPTSKNIFGKRAARKPVRYAGRGARTYHLIGQWTPPGLVGWMLGLRTGYATPVESASGSGSETGWEKIDR
ncbi:DUF1776 domain-containing protein [Aspergillus mulundensis]|uniref:DUF1776-domain-containing protein n=1 Tax=Aspergillus mulundensis TaxID=1810919 RepID=A0A3D8RA49_9EURO|nr:Uncharacterized protein DSM5745_08299 [Aspergillus mulundensis]RDW70788.1 Uncharacterized protein DSM5745_08299 [Aspergillus mulundensis]